MLALFKQGSNNPSLLEHFDARCEAGNTLDANELAYTVWTTLLHSSNSMEKMLKKP